jgi:hypothetical protein
MAFPYHLLLVLSLLCQLVIDTNVSIDQSSGYRAQPLCAALSLSNPNTYVDMRSNMGCPANPLGQNECYCRQDLRSAAYAYLTKCVSTACGPNTAEVANLISVYTDYCFTAVGAVTVAPTTTAATTTLNSNSGGNPAANSPAVPALILVPITTGPPTAPTPHSSIPSYSDTGSLLRGYCATAEYVLLDGPTAFWAPAVGCVGDKTDCCPYSVKSTASVATITVVSASTVTVSVDPSGANSPYAGVQAYPTPASSNLATLAHCPDDYVSVLDGCCPS